MHHLKFTLNPDHVTRIHDAVQCLAKFSDVVSLEARSNHVRSLCFATAGSSLIRIEAYIDCFEFLEICIRLLHAA